MPTSSGSASPPHRDAGSRRSSSAPRGSSRASSTHRPSLRTLSGQNLAQDRAQAEHIRRARRACRSRRALARAPCMPACPPPSRQREAASSSGPVPRSSHDRRRAARRSRGRAARPWPGPSRRPEPRQSADHHVAGLQVAVHHAARVSVRHRLTDLFKDVQEACRVLRPTSARREQLGQRSPLNQLHREVRPCVGNPAELVNRARCRDAGAARRSEPLRRSAAPARDRLEWCSSKSLTARSRPSSESQHRGHCPHCAASDLAEKLIATRDRQHQKTNPTRRSAKNRHHDQVPVPRCEGEKALLAISDEGWLKKPVDREIHGQADHSSPSGSSSSSPRFNRHPGRGQL